MGRFSTELFERYQRSEKALVGTLAEMYVQGVSTRKVEAVTETLTETLCGHSFSASSIGEVLPQAAWQRSITCRAKSMTIACRSCAGSEPVLGPAKPDLGDRRDLGEARRDIAQWLGKWQTKYPRLCDWVEDNIEETLTP